MDSTWEPQTNSFGNSRPAIQQLCELNKCTQDQIATYHLLITLKTTKFNKDGWKDDISVMLIMSRSVQMETVWIVNITVSMKSYQFFMFHATAVSSDTEHACVEWEQPQ
jgi:hypothetical protein